MSVALVIVSHSARLAEGVEELAAQMAPDVPIRAAGGLPDGGIGTSFDRVAGAIDGLLAGGYEVLVLTDLGSATMVAESALEFLDDGTPARLANAPLVEGAVAAAAIAQGGGSLQATWEAAEGAHTPAVLEPPERKGAAGQPPAGPPLVPEPDGPLELPGAVQVQTTMVNEMGMHARPAAQIASLATAREAQVTVNGADASSVIALLSLGLGCGDAVTVSASGPEAQQAAEAVAGLISSGFGEA